MSNDTIQFTDGNKTLALVQIQAARIAELEAALAAAQERERALVELLRRHRYTDGPRNSGGCCISCGQAYYSGCSADCDIDAALAAAQQEGK